MLDFAQLDEAGVCALHRKCQAVRGAVTVAAGRLQALRGEMIGRNENLFEQRHVLYEKALLIREQADLIMACVKELEALD